MLDISTNLSSYFVVPSFMIYRNQMVTFIGSNIISLKNSKPIELCTRIFTIVCIINIVIKYIY